MKTLVGNNEVTVYLNGKIDSDNSAEFEKEMLEIIGNNKDKSIIIDCSELNYISSAGLRVILKIKKQSDDIKLINVMSDVYEIFSVTGFTEIISVSKKLNEVTIDNARLLGAGANGKVYRLDPERIVKVYNSVSNPPEKIRREQESARQAFVHGIPSAIPFDIVKVGNELGMIYELINAQTLGNIIHNDPQKLEYYAHKMAALMKKLHSTEMKKDTMPDSHLSLKVWADIADKSGYYDPDNIRKIYELIDSVPVRNTFIHGDFHPGNIMVSEGELILIDIGDASAGHPVFDLLGTFQLMCLIPKQNDKAAMRYTGMSTEEVIRMWDIFIRDYLGTNDESVIAGIEGSLRCYALIRSLGGIVFSDVVPDEKRKLFSAMIMKDFLSSLERSDIVINTL